MNLGHADEDVALFPALCWGQRHLWLRHSDLPVGARPEYNIDLRVEPPLGATVASLCATVDTLVQRHEALRTTFGYVAGSAVQRVLPPGTVTCDVAELGNRPGAQEDAVREFVAVPFDLAVGPPIRARVLTHAHQPVLLVIVVHHVAVDDWAISRLNHEFMTIHASVTALRQVILPAVRTQPSDLARYEATEEARSLNRRALAYWDSYLERIPGDVFTERKPRTPGEPVAFSASLVSAKAAAAVRRLAGRHRAWPVTVHAAAFSALLAACTGSEEPSFLSYGANRDADLRAEVVTNEAQPVPLRVPGTTAETTFADVVRHVARGADEAASYSPCAYDEVLEAVAAHSAKRGVGLRLGVYFNYLNYAPAPHGMAADGLAWHEEPVDWAVQADDVYFRVHEYRDGIVITINAMSTVMGRRDVERFLRGFEDLLLAQADSTDHLTIAEVAELAGFGRGRSDDSVTLSHPAERCLAGHPNVRMARVFSHPDGTTHANVTVTDPDLTPALLRLHVVEQLFDHTGMRCPGEFTTYSDVPMVPGDLAAWAAMPALHRGDGLASLELEPVSEADIALHEAVTVANGLTGLSMAQSYVSAGGRLMNVPFVQNMLRDNGWTGARLRLLASALPLRGVAMRLTGADSATPGSS